MVDSGAATEENTDESLELDGLSDLLAALSEGDAPKDLGDGPTSFAAEDVDWESNEWMTYLASIQGWLRLSDEMDLNQGPEAALQSLFASIGSVKPGDCFAIDGGVARLTALGFSDLEAHLTQASRNKEAFQADLDNAVSASEASKRWVESWEAESTVNDNLPAKVIASVDAWVPKTFKGRAEENGLDLNPSYQRDVVWSNSDSQKLIDSILRGIPLPSIILNQRKGTERLEIVDGKQRLTAILRFIGAHPDGIAYARKMCTKDAPWELYKKNFRKWSRKLGIKAAEARENFLPFRLRSYHPEDQLAQLSGKYYNEILDEAVQVQGKEQPVQTVFERENSKYKIPIILYEDTDLQQIHRVFGLYNRQGKQLNAEELRNAIYHHLDLTKLVLLLAGDSADIELAPYLEGCDRSVIPTVLHEMSVSRKRFHRTKLVSWVSAILVQPLAKKNGGVSICSTSKIIDTMLSELGENSSHVMRRTPALNSLANDLINGMSLLQALRLEEGIAPKFTHKRSPGAKWDDLPVVASWIGCTLASIGGVSVGDAEDLSPRVREVTEQRPPLAKQQSRTQWGYLAERVIALLGAMGIDSKTMGPRLEEKFGHSCIETFSAVQDLKIEFE